MNKFLELYKLPRLNHNQIENLNRSVTNKEIQSVVKNLPIKKNPGPDGFTGEFHKIPKEKLIPSFLNSSKKIKEENNSSYTHLTRPALP